MPVAIYNPLNENSASDYCCRFCIAWIPVGRGPGSGVLGCIRQGKHRLRGRRSLWRCLECALSGDAIDAAVRECLAQCAEQGVHALWVFSTSAEDSDIIPDFDWGNWEGVFDLDLGWVVSARCMALSRIDETSYSDGPGFGDTKKDAVNDLCNLQSLDDIEFVKCNRE